jgi:hypothetical protein
MAGCCDHDHNKKPVHGAVMQQPMIMPTTMIMTTVTLTTMLIVMRA